ncbi:MULTISPECIES: DeoR/GlpR family DNA-binding transcription regulator [Oceanobacillus]|uniref:DeoR family transcriptional regulator n=1 Tax=Oceanobacillus kimchii TaxID=746691 RepID=A0ABQ5TEN1_9BACI|nr:MULTISPECIES: DeoR/GlpR family DNA-binding transcription regulator [Oceanobacillus]MBT2601041.1 DeoR/GlpR transcriptional regulator [Oceanobacillus sp. ISL-74]MBT2653508.1 DeoR/GlpR transcriptional regulator [Oceanobacillus sp. ISL-73]OEH53285.1 DeoR family transcriptional regulator [Oceanobacillus sp. E9]GLO65303.1 DeoR family transcriptional regulator [Oceanobacillus kimchii]
MLTDERHRQILKKLNESGVVKSLDLISDLNCSESTIRRDLAQLEEDGLLTRIHGGAKKHYSFDKEPTYQEKTIKNVQHKASIGKFAASLIEENDVIYLDAGTTTLEMIPYLPDISFTVVTNGIVHASMLTNKQIPSYLVGGKLKHSTNAIVGSSSLRQLKEYQFTKAFLGVNGIDLRYGCTTADPEEAAMKSSALQQASTAYMLADESKWNNVNFAKICNINDVIFITEKLTSLHEAFQLHTNILEAT